MSKEPAPRQRILDVTIELLESKGVEGVSVRDVCERAGVKAPTVYHHFGDKDGLLEAVVTAGFERYLEEKRKRAPSGDPVADLCRGWDGHVEFGVTHPAFYALMYGTPRPAKRHPAALEGEEILTELVRRIAEAGRLLLPTPEVVHIVHSATVGTTLTLITEPEAPGAEHLSQRVRDAVFASVISGYGHPAERRDGLARQALTLLVTLSAQSEGVPLTGGERALLAELLGKLAV
ncbi:AcrR family transcriptional regulator [Thermocatellispora tengchongensis]|uniref:AcrR family transcriptional regulator n=1 Tax=Thermocatellispora tengchongensis TaxID=1073253 RepID=A0A840PMN9_9ACTN|nr:TetR/AcrR family transcriptional regulator [Thermocatellispora tengchongensis]MBB5137315.1 AcrR family transcriptional regulator [Thermocatellispora tengchongensis]